MKRYIYILLSFLSVTTAHAFDKGNYGSTGYTKLKERKEPRVTGREIVERTNNLATAIKEKDTKKIEAEVTKIRERGIADKVIAQAESQHPDEAQSIKKALEAKPVEVSEIQVHVK